MKKIFCIGLAAALLSTTALASNPEITETVPGQRVYCGDPATLVEDTDGDGVGDKVYLYVGEDRGDGAYYNMPNYLCYSTTDMVNWTYEGIPMKAGDFSWGSASDAWAAQVVKYNGKYYYYMCKNSTGISVGISDSPTGPFKALAGGPMIWRELTDGKVWHRTIDPTVWIENDENNVEHRYIMWGNSNLYMTELNTDMVSVADLNGSGNLDKGDIKEIEITGIPEKNQYTEAPWIYKRPGDDRYYIFFATNWQEELSYAVSDNIWGPYEYAGLIMTVGASSNTNHPAVLDFKGQTYIVYHTGAQPNGGGYLRNVCIDRLYFDENGGVAQLEESSIGLDGTAVTLTLDGEKLSQVHFDNSLRPSAYPAGTTLRLGENALYPTDSEWEIVEGNGGVYIQSVNKMGYYITAYRGFVKLLHDEDDNKASLDARTFIPIERGEGTAYESVSVPGKYLGVDGSGNIILSDTPLYFTITERAEQSLSVKVEGKEIIATGTGEPEAELIVVVSGPDGTSIGYAKADDEGNFTYSFTPETFGTYHITASGRVAEITFGGEEE